MKVFVVGGTGAIGARAVRVLLENGHTVLATARDAEKASALKAIGAETTDVDIYDVGSLRRAMRGFDAVARLTTKIPQSPLSMRSKRAWQETNRLRALGSKMIVDAALAEGLGVYVQESFFSVYRDAGTQWVDEVCPTNDGGFDTMRAALSAEAEAARFSRSGGIGVTLRFGGYYSAHNDLSRAMLDMVKKRMLPQIGSGNFYFPSIDLDDAAQSVVHALRAPAGLYNVCDDEPMLWREVLAEIAAAADAPPPMKLPAFMGSIAIGYPWGWMSRSIRLSNRRFKEVTGWQPRVRNARDGWRAIVKCISGTTELAATRA